MLLLFTVCYVGWRSGKPEGPGGAVAPAPPAGRRRPDRGAQLPDPARVSGGLLAAPGRPLLLLPELAVLFVLGLAAGERGWLAGRPPPLVRRVCWLAPPSAIAVLAGTVLATAVAGLYAALSGSARSPIPAVEPSEAELPRGVITKRLSWRCQVSPLLGTFTPTMGRDSASPSRRQRPIGRHLEVHLVATVEQRQDDIAACMTPG